MAGAARFSRFLSSGSGLQRLLHVFDRRGAVSAYTVNQFSILILMAIEISQRLQAPKKAETQRRACNCARASAETSLGWDSFVGGSQSHASHPQRRLSTWWPPHLTLDRFR